MIPWRERLYVSFEVLADHLLDGCAVTAIIVISLIAAAMLVYRSSPPVASSAREFTGKIVDKRTSVYESQEGSFFTNTLVIEEKTGRRFTFNVTDESYARAKVGMWIRRTKRGIDFLTEREMNEQSP